MTIHTHLQKNVNYETLRRPRKWVSRWACEFTQEDWERCWAYEREGYDHEIAVIKVHYENWQMKCFTWQAEKLERMGEYEEAAKLRIMGGEERLPEMGLENVWFEDRTDVVHDGECPHGVYEAFCLTCAEAKKPQMGDAITI